MGKYLDRAHELRAITEPHYNCTQAVLVPFAERFGLSEETAFNLGANFGGGMKSGTVCGVITGGLLVLGLAGFDQPSDAKNFIAKIREKHDGMMMCADLLRANAERGGIKKQHCDKMVYEAIEILETLLDGQEQ